RRTIARGSPLAAARALPALRRETPWRRLPRRIRPAQDPSAPPSKVLRQPEAGELPLLVRVEEVPVARPRVAARRRAAGPLEHPLSRHELAVVLADRARRRLEARIGQVGGASELPAVAEQRRPAARQRRPRPVELVARRRVVILSDRLPLELGGQPGARPGRVGIGFEVRDVRDRSPGVANLPSAMREVLPLEPVERRLDPLATNPVPP